MVRSLLILLALLLQSGVARADVVGPAPTCPIGGDPSVCHGLAYCAIDGCVSAAECGPGRTCAARELCIGTGTCFGRGGSSPVTTVEGPDCSGCGGRCESHFVCVPGGIDAGAGMLDAGRPMDAGGGSSTVRYCGCAVPSRGGPPSTTVVVGGLLLAVLAFRRR